MAHRSDPSPPSELAQLNEHISALIATDKQLLAEMIAIERSGTLPEEPKAGDSVASRAKHYLNGFDSLPSLGLTSGERLFVIRQDRAAIERALSQLEQMRQRHLAVLSVAAAEAATPRWEALIKRQVAWAAEGRALHEAMATMRAETGGVNLPHQIHFGARPFLGVPWINDPGGAATAYALKAGIISERELKEAAKL